MSLVVHNRNRGVIPFQSREGALASNEENVYLLGEQTGVYLRTQRARYQRRLRVDNETVAEAAIRHIAVFFGRLGGTSLCDSETLKSLEVSPLSLSECKIAMAIIKNDFRVRVVSNEVNRVPTGEVLIAKVITMCIQDEKILASIGSNVTNIMRSASYNEIEFLALSTQAFNAIERHIISLEKQQKASAQAQSFSCSTSLKLDHIPPLQGDYYLNIKCCTLF